MRWFDNLPVVSYLLLRGTCRDCGAGFSWRYPAVEAGVAVLWATTGFLLGWNRLLPVALFALAAGVVLALIDFDVQRLPDSIMAIAYPAVTGGLLFAGWGDPHAPWARAGFAALFWFSVFAIPFLITLGRAMGLGDVKLAPLLGLLLGWAGWPAVIVGCFVAFLIASVVGITLRVRGVLGRRAAIPFGPFMIGGALAGVLIGAPVAGIYLSATGLA